MRRANNITSVQSPKIPVFYQLLRLRDLEGNYGYETGKYKDPGIRQEDLGKTMEISAGIISVPIEIRPRYISNASPTH